MDSLIKEQLKYKMDDIDKLFEEYELIFVQIKNETPDLFYITILGSVLHSFYNGVENIFEIIAKNVDEFVPNGNKSHQELLKQMNEKNMRRDAVINDEIYMKLREYATFRHFYRHAYSFQLNWEKMKPLVEDVHDLWRFLKKELSEFINKQS